MRLGRYEVRALLGAGGMGEVYLAFDHDLERPSFAAAGRFSPSSWRDSSAVRGLPAGSIPIALRTNTSTTPLSA